MPVLQVGELRPGEQHKQEQTHKVHHLLVILAVLLPRWPREPLALMSGLYRCGPLCLWPLKDEDLTQFHQNENVR